MKRYLYIQIVLLVWIFLGCKSGHDTTYITVLTYHRIDNNSESEFTVNEDNFKEQIKYLSGKGYKTISLDDYNDFLTKGIRLPRKPILITFDDGYKEHFEKAFPILKKYGFTGTIFIITSKIENNKGLTQKQLREMVENGFSVGSHSINHKSLIGTEREVLEREVTDSKKKLERITGRKVNFIAYPYGYFDQQVIDAIRVAGYSGAFTIIPGRNNRKTSRFEQRRVVITKGVNLTSFKKLLEGDKELYTKIYEFEVMQYLKRGLTRPAEIELRELLDINPENTFAEKLLNHIEAFKKDVRD